MTQQPPAISTKDLLRFIRERLDGAVAVAKAWPSCPRDARLAHRDHAAWAAVTDGAYHPSRPPPQPIAGFPATGPERRHRISGAFPSVVPAT